MKIGIIGGGPAGYIAAIRAAQFGADVVVIERDNVGGTCTNYGCIPTKALYSAAHKLIDFQWGIKKKMWLGQLSPDWRMIQNFKNSVVRRSIKGIEFLFKKNKITLIKGEARFLSPVEIEVEGAKGAEIFEFDRIILATGSRASIPPVEGLAGISPWDNIKALSTGKIPESLIILGGGVVGVEFAHVFRTFGSEVTIVELLPKILPFQDDEVGAAVNRALVGEGIKLMTSKKAVAAHRHDKGVRLEFMDGEILEAEEIIVATGRKVLLPDGAEKAGLKLDKNLLPVDEERRTGADAIYAAGDITGEPHLAHKASHEGIVAAEHIMGKDSKFDCESIPAAIFTALEVGAAGLTEKQARDKFGDSIKVGKFPYVASGRAQAEGDPFGFVKIIANGDSRIVGFHAAGRHASELLGTGGFLVQYKIPLSEITETIFAHPTLSEMLAESALAAMGKAIHL